MVHGELQLGRGSGARAGRDSKFPATARQAGADGGNCGHWQGGRQTASGKLDRSPSGGTRRTATRDAKRDRGTFAKLLGRPVRMEAVPRESWEGLFKSQGTKNPLPRLQMLDGLTKAGSISNGEASGSEKGSVPLETVLKALMKVKGMPTLIEHFGFWPLVAQSLPRRPKHLTIAGATTGREENSEVEIRK